MIVSNTAALIVYTLMRVALTFPVAPFGRFCPLREDLHKATKMESQGGTGGAYKFWEWTENQVKPYL